MSGRGPRGLASREEAARSKAQVLAVSGRLLATLGRAGRFPSPPRGRWAGCDDRGGKVAYQVTGRLDADAGGSGRLAPVVAVRARLTGAGVRLAAAGRGTDPVTLRGRAEAVSVQVTGYRTRPVVLLELWGDCLDVGDLDEDLLGEPPERLSPG